ncbi:MAG: hypothetical protein IPL19_09685 [Sandaracinaceae bacterium]|jgi:hypothetical protein|nr:hypothetical protein [Sandaracinaceae bacterium]MBK7775296.1 hypothetical protein [Sandaracinaceae bacterium]MBK8408235.1 hypothetical protein [Sandaracinaceae bacterium]MBP7681277.1 hypothetical protein [Deltaproteobacteria bacterium]
MGFRFIILLSFTASLACQPAPEEEPPSQVETMRRRGEALAQRNATPAAVPANPAPNAPLTEAERADVALLAEVVGAAPDAVEIVLLDVDGAVERDLPVRAAGVLTERALPASRAQLARLQEIEPRSELGTLLHEQWLLAWTTRETALTRYAAALERGIVEDLTLADALRDQRHAGDAVAAARVALADALRRIDASAEGE